MIKKLGRNDHCWCGSGKKYKACHEAFDDKLRYLEDIGHIVPSHKLIKTPEQIEKIKESARINVACLDAVAAAIHEGMNTAEIDKIVYDVTTDMGGIPAPLNYEGYPYSVCTSVNEQVCHGFPSKDVILKSGDIVNVDCSTILHGYFSDSSRMFCIGNVAPEHKKLVDVAKECGLPVLRVPAYSPQSVAEQGAALLMAVNRKPHLSYERTTKFNFDIAGLTGIALYGKTAGIIGTGKIGQCMINILKGFGMDIVAYDAFPNPNLGLEYVTLDELYARADVISIHCPLMPATRHMIDKDAIAKMKDGVIFINVARGGLVDSEALADAVEAGKFRGVGMDVCEKEHEYFFEDRSNLKEHDKTLSRLLASDKVVISGHQAFLTEEALEQMALITMDNAKAFLEGAELVNEVK